MRAAALALLLAAMPVGAQELPALYSVSGVARDDALNVRAAPDAASARLGALPPDARGVEVVELAAGGRWGRVNIGERSGWVAMRYMAAEGGPGWHTLAAPLHCFGTEPFWNLAIAPGAERVTYAGLGIDERDLGPAEAWEGPAFGARSLGLLLGQEAGFAVIRAEACADGMSDRAHGLSALLFLRDRGEGGGLSGCCTLAR